MKSVKIYAVLFLVTIISSTYGQNINDALRLSFPGLGSSARALGMGNAYIGLSDDASAVFFNPAGLGLLKRIEFSGGLDYQSFSNDAQLYSRTTSSTTTSTNLNRFSFAFPFPTLRGSLVVGLSYHQQKDLTGGVEFSGINRGNTSWIRRFALNNSNVLYDLYLSYERPTNDTTNIFGGLQESGDILQKGSINNWTFHGAVEVYKNLYIGLNLNIISGTYESDNDYYEDDVNNLYQGETVPGEPRTTDFRSFHINRNIDWDLSGWDAKFGLLYREKFASLGVTVQFPKFYTIKEKFEVEAESEFQTNTFSIYPEDYSDEVEYDITTPFVLGGGFAVNYQGFIFSGEMSLTDYSQTEFSNPIGLSESSLDQQNKDIKDLLGSVFSYNVGLEYTIPRIGLRLRTGYFTQPSPYLDDPSEYDRKYFTFGAGYLADEKIGIDVGYAHGWWSDFGDNYGVNISRTLQEITLDKVMLSVTYRF